MKTVIVNGETHAVEADTLDTLLHSLGYEGHWLGTALNGELVPREERPLAAIGDGDRVEVLSPMQGG